MNLPARQFASDGPGPQRERSPEFDAMVERVHAELRMLAHNLLRRERRGHTLRTTDLMHEAYLRLVKQGSIVASDRPRFLMTATKMIRRILIDHARGRRTQKRGGGIVHLALGEVEIAGGASTATVRQIDEALSALQEIELRAAEVAEMRLFGGCSFEEIATAFGISTGLAFKLWRKARAWIADRVDDP